MTVESSLISVSPALPVAPCFGGKRTLATRTSRTGPARFDARKLIPLLERAKARLSGVVIEYLPWAEFIERYDREGVLFYLDPPYHAKGALYH